MESKPKNKHHYVQAAYLAGFTVNGHKEGNLHVLDKSNQKTFISKPISIAYENKLYYLEEEGYEPDLMENDFAVGIENDFIKLLKEIQKTQRLPHRVDKQHTLAKYIAFTDLRNLEMFMDMNRHVEKTAADVLASEERLARYYKDVQAIFPDWTQEKAKAEMTRYHRELKANIDNRPIIKQFYLKNVLIDALSDESRLLLEKLREHAAYGILATQITGIVSRYWVLAIAPKHEGSRIYCSDHPAMIKKPKVQDFFDISNRIRKVTIIFPLTSNICFIGCDQDPKTKKLNLNIQELKNINLLISSHGRRFIFSSAPFTDQYQHCSQ